jgi:hypothetical protein
VWNFTDELMQHWTGWIAFDFQLRHVGHNRG